jgi:hypothetical protein
MSSSISLTSILDAKKLTRPNFLNRYRNVKIVLKQERRLYVFENPILLAPDEDVDEEVRNTYQHHIDEVE